MNNTMNLEKNKTIRSIATGYIVSLVASIICLFIYALLLSKTNINESTITPVIITITSICILIGSSISSIKIKKNGIINGVLVGVIYYLTLYILSSFAGTGFTVNLKTLLMVLSGIVLGGIGGIIGVNFRK